MRTFTNILLVFFLLAVFSCTTDSSKEAVSSNAKNPSQKTIINSGGDLNQYQEHEDNYGVPIQTVTQSTLIWEKHGCFKARISIIDILPSGTRILVASGTTILGPGCNGDEERNSPNQDNPGKDGCASGFLENGDYIADDNFDTKYCLLNLLQTNKKVYQQYLDSIDELLPDLER